MQQILISSHKSSLILLVKCHHGLEEEDVKDKMGVAPSLFKGCPLV